MRAKINAIGREPNLVAAVLGATALFLVLASTAGQFMTYLAGLDRSVGLVGLFFVDVERNIPTVFSVALLLTASVLLWIIAAGARRSADAAVPYWAALGLGFLYMAADEMFSYHEKTMQPIRDLLGWESLGVFYFAWVIPGIAIVLAVVLLFSGFLRRLPASTRRWFLVAGVLYVSGAIGTELVGGWFAETHGTVNLIYAMIVTLEESLEMAGVIVFVWALLSYLAEYSGAERTT